MAVSLLYYQLNRRVGELVDSVKLEGSDRDASDSHYVDEFMIATLQIFIEQPYKRVTESGLNFIWRLFIEGIQQDTNY